MSKILRALVGAVLVVGFAMTSAGPASADTGDDENCVTKTDIRQICRIYWINENHKRVSEVAFHLYDEKLGLIDHWADGRGVVARISWGSTYDHVYNTLGANKAVWKDYNITDGTRVYITACQTNNGKELNCVYTHIYA
jgi:hypothetical protein